AKEASIEWRAGSTRCRTAMCCCSNSTFKSSRVQNALEKLGELFALLRPGVALKQPRLQRGPAPAQFGARRAGHGAQSVRQVSVKVAVIEIEGFVAEHFVHARKARCEDGASAQGELEDFRGKVVVVSGHVGPRVDKDIASGGELQALIRA